MPQEKIAIVTGAGSGIGRSCALLLAETGYVVTLVARTAAKLEETAALIRAQSPDSRVLVRAADVSDESAVRAVVDATLTAFGRLDAVANVAGYAPLGPIETLDTADYRKCLAVNLDAVVFMTRAVWATMKRQKAGVICNVSSLASVDPFTGFSVYGAAKAAVNIFTRAAADEGREWGITTVCIAPGAVETPMLREHFGLDSIPADKTLAPTDVAAVIRDCVTGKRAFTPGETILLPSP